MTAKPLYPKLAKFITYHYTLYMLKHGRVSLNEFGESMGLSSASISRYAGWKVFPKPPIQDKIASCLGPGIYDALGVPRRVPKDSKLVNSLMEVLPDMNSDEIANLQDTVDRLRERYKIKDTEQIQQLMLPE